MFLSRRNFTFFAVGFALALGIGLTLSVSAQSPAAGPDVTAAVSGTVSGSSVTYSVNLTNNTANVIGNLYIAVKVPKGVTNVKDSATPAGAGFQGVQDGNAVWLANSISANGKLGPFTFTGTTPGGALEPVNAYVHWAIPSDGVATSTEATWSEVLTASAPRRGCTACHIEGGADAKGKYSLYWEAEERAEARGGTHPTALPDGSPLTFRTNAEDCLQCHKPGTGDRAGKGAFAPLALRDIVHPAHTFSAGFKNNYNGGCFTCHNVAGDGTWQLLTRKVDANEKGVPNPAKLPIPGAISPSER